MEHNVQINQINDIHIIGSLFLSYRIIHSKYFFIFEIIIRFDLIIAHTNIFAIDAIHIQSKLS
jgi:hypothetical protein